MVTASPNLLTSNPVAEAFEARTGQLSAQRNAAEKQADDDMLRVFEFAGDGHIDEARFYAQQKGLQVPDQVYTNADFAKGLTLAGKIYGDNPEQAQKFTTAWMANQGDFNTRLAAAQTAAGSASNPEDRQLQRQIALERWKLSNRPASEKRDIRTINNRLVELMPDGTTKELYNGGGTGFDPVEIGTKAYNSALSGGLSDNPQAQAQDAVNFARGLYDQTQQAAPPPSTVLRAPQGATPNLIQSSSPQQQIPSGLPAGSVMIGTANGRPVYQAPTGEKFIDDGNP